MTLPSDLGSAMAMLGELVHDDRLAYGLWTVFGVLVFSGVIAGLIVTAWSKR